MKYYYITLFFLVCSSFPVFANTETENKSLAVLTVEVLNKTANGTTVKNDEIVLQIYRHQQLFDTLEGQASEDDKAIFNNVPTGDEFIAIPQAKHMEMLFTGQAVKLSSGENKFDAQVEVFDVSLDKSKLSVLMHHFIIKESPETKSLEITEFLQLVNSSDMAISSKERDKQGHAIVLDIKLPKGFRNLQWTSYFEENAIVVTEDGFYDIMAVPPGSNQATFSYTLDISSSTMDILKKISLPTDNFLVFAQGQVQLHALNDANAKVMNMNGTSMEYLKFSNIVPPKEITFQVTGLTVDKHNIITWIILTAAFIAMIIFAIVRSGTSK